MRRSYFGWKIWIGVWALGILPSAALALNPIPPVSPGDLYRGQRLETYSVTNDLAELRQGNAWRFSEKQHCNFTHFSPEAKEVTFGAEGLRFTTSGEKVTVGWENYDGLQPEAERVMMFSGWNEIELKVRQSAQSSIWTLALWASGSAEPGRYSHEKIAFWAVPKDEKKVEGAQWQSVRFRAYRAGADGFGLTIKGPAGNCIEIASIRMTQSLGQGCFRKEFDLPKGAIWRACAEIPRTLTLTVNPFALRRQP
jgi:hypothetical protein